MRTPGDDHETIRQSPSGVFGALDLPQSLFDLLPTAICICDIDGLVVRYNRRAADLLGRPPQLDTLATRLGAPQRPNGYASGPLPPLVSPVAEVLRTGVALRNLEVVIEREGVIGRPASAPTVALVTAEAVRNDAGAITGAIICLHDITGARPADAGQPYNGHNGRPAAGGAVERRPPATDAVGYRHDLEDFFENGAIALHLVAQDGTILRANQAELDLLGYTREEYVGRNIADFHDKAKIGDIFDRLSSGKGLDKYPARMKAKDGSFRHVQITSNALIENGKFVNTRCFTVDVTAQIQAEEVLRNRERRVHDLLGTLPVAVYTTDPEGRITFYNRAAAQLWGRQPALGIDRWCGSFRLYWPDGRPMRHDECPMAEALRQGRPIHGAEAKGERPDGTRVAFLAFPTLLRDASGAVTGALNTLVDITERDHALEVDQRLTAIVDSCDEAIISTDLDGVIVTWNRGAERLYGYKAVEAVGKPVTLLTPAGHSDEEAVTLARIRRGEPIDHSEVTRQRRDRSLVEVSLSMSPVRDAQGRITGAAKIAHDISGRKRAEEQLQLLLREMDHRIKNLFAVAHSVVTLSACAARTPAEVVTVIQGRLGALARAYKLVRPDVPHAGETEDQDTTLGELIQMILLPYIGTEDLDSHTRVIADGPVVSLGRSAVTNMALVLHELATNAAKYGALSVPHGEVAIDWSVRAADLVLNWAERNGPALEGPPPSEGFGSQLARASVGSQLGGKLSQNWRPGGLAIEVVIPTERLAR